MEINTTECCGIRELANIQGHEDARDVLLDAVPELVGTMDGAFVFFSCNDESEMGDELMNYIINNNLGTVSPTRPVHNPNSGNDLIMYVWTVDLEAMRMWLEVETQPEPEPEPIVMGLGDRQITVGAGVGHTTYGVGIVRTLRQGHNASVGVEFVNGGGNKHNLDGAIESERGMWVSPTRTRVLA